MSEIDEFASQLLEEAKRFLELSDVKADQERHAAYLHAALLTAFASLEAHVNAICEEVSQRPEFSVHEAAFLQEEEVRLEKGKFQRSGLKMSKLEDRISFLLARFSGVETKTEILSSLKGATRLRNKLTHPKSNPGITEKGVQDALQAIIDILDTIYKAIYKKRFPAANRKLQSKLIF